MDLCFGRPKQWLSRLLLPSFKPCKRVLRLFCAPDITQRGSVLVPMEFAALARHPIENLAPLNGGDKARYNGVAAPVPLPAKQRPRMLPHQGVNSFLLPQRAGRNALKAQNDW
jgi:hypothetical protein